VPVQHGPPARPRIALPSSDRPRAARSPDLECLRTGQLLDLQPVLAVADPRLRLTTPAWKRMPASRSGRIGHCEMKITAGSQPPNPTYHQKQIAE
jgi:hypothetical protein